MTPEWIASNELCSHGERRKFCSSCAQAIGFGVLAAESVEWPEHMIEAECTRLLEQDGWRALRTDPVSDRGRGKGFGELGMADHEYIRYGAPTWVLRWQRQFPILESLDLSGHAEVLWVEYKAHDGKPKKHQIEWHTKERARGALTWIAGVDFHASVDGFRKHYAASGLQRRSAL